MAAIAIGCGGPHDQKLKLALEHLNVAGRQGVDIACLPEKFAGDVAEPVPGPTTKAVAALARQYHMYVVCPIREQGDDGRQYNTALLLAQQKGKVELLPDVGDMEGWYVLRAVAPGVRVRDLCKQYGIETLREYRHRSRDQINDLRRLGEPISMPQNQATAIGQ